MKATFLVFACITGLALAQDKPRVFVQGKGSQDVTTSGGSWSSRSTVDSHDESMEVTKNLQKDCTGIVVTLIQSNADYTVVLNRESKHNRGLLRTNSQIQVANRVGDILGTNATRTVGNASKDACRLILADWSQHGSMPTSEPTPAPASSSVAPTTVAARVQTISAVQSPPTTLAVDTTSTTAKTDSFSSNIASDVEANPKSSALTYGVTAEISSDPSGADIEIDGGFVGTTPSSVGIGAGEHTLRVLRNGYQPWERTLRSSTGNIKIAAALEAMSATASEVDGPVIAPLPVRVAEHAAGFSSGYPEEIFMGVSFAGNPTARHDGVEISGVQPKGPADAIDLRPGDVILAIDAHYLFTIDEVRAEILRYRPGARLLIRYRRNQFISENFIVLDAKNSIPER